MKAKEITIFGETKTIKEWAADERRVIPYTAFKDRLKKGRAPQEALTTERQKSVAGKDVKVGDKINRLTIKKLYSVEKYGQNMTYAEVECDCVDKTIKQVKLAVIQDETTKSCGCWKSEVKSKECSERNYKHGKGDLHNRLYRIWCQIRARCDKKYIPHYENYGGRGIKVYKDWYNFVEFEKWSLNNGYKDQLTLDRINNDGNYEPKNCQWITIQEQQKNKRSNVIITAWGESKILNDWEKDSRCNIGYRSISYRISVGWSPEKAISKPAQKANVLDLDNRLYRIWKGMKNRCYNPNSINYKNWGERDIKICNEWLNFNNFYAWAIKNGYNDYLSIDRIDNNKNYTPENCKWVSQLEQANNKRNSFFITAWGETKTASEWSRDKRAKIRRSMIVYRINNGWKPELAISKPSKNQKL